MRAKKDINIRVGKNIQSAREAAGYTQEQLSELLEMTPNHLSAIERGASGATLETLEQLCRLLRTSADALLFGYRGQRDDWGAEVALQMEAIAPKHRPQVEKILLALLEMSKAQELEDE